MRNNYETYHLGVFPRSVYASMNTENDPKYFRLAMDDVIYDLCAGGTTPDYEQTSIGYNPITRIFTFSCGSMGRTRQVTLSQLRTAAQELADGNSTDTSTSEYTWDADNLNAQRSTPQWNNGDSYDDGSAWAGYTPDPYID